MGVLDLVTWDFFAGISGDPNKYKAYLIIALVFLNINAWAVPKTTFKNTVFLIALIWLHYFEWIDIRDNPNASFIDTYYASMVLSCYILYSLFSIGGLRHAWKHHQLHKYDIPKRRLTSVSNGRLGSGGAVPMGARRDYLKRKK